MGRANGRGLGAALAVLLLLGAATAAAAQDGGKKDGRPVSGDDAAKAAIGRFDRDFKASDLGKKMNAIHSLAATKNDLVTRKLGTLLGHPNYEIRMAAAMCLDDQYQNRELSGEILRKILAQKKESEAEVLITIMLSLGRIPYATAIPEMGEVLKNDENVFVKIEALKSFGKMKDTRALLPILELWLKNPQGYSWEGGEVNYDSGAPGDHDQKKAEQMYKEKYGNQQRRGAPPAMLKTYIQAIVNAVEQICGEKLGTPTELMRWMVKHEKELPYELPGMVKKTLQEFEERAEKRKKPK